MRVGSCTPSAFSRFQILPLAIGHSSQASFVIRSGPPFGLLAVELLELRNLCWRQNRRQLILFLTRNISSTATESPRTTFSAASMLLSLVTRRPRIAFVSVGCGAVVDRITIFDDDVLETILLSRGDSELFFQPCQAGIRVMNNDRIFGHGRTGATERDHQRPTDNIQRMHAAKP